MGKFETYLSRYDYEFPEKLIANQPASPRDKARLLVYRKKENQIHYDTFSNLINYLPQNAILVFNQTKVIPARLFLKKETGGKVEVLFLDKTKNELKVISNLKLNLGAKLFLTNNIFFAVKAQEEKYYYLTPSFSIEKLESILEKYGFPPIPPYIKNIKLSRKALKEKYQSVFAKNKGAIAAPTASLHFTKRLIKKIRKSGIKIYFVTLHVGLGTFAPLTEEQLKSRKLHREYYEIDRKTADYLNYAKRQGKPIIAVGSTTLRALESASNKMGELRKLSGETELFIKENYKLRFVKNLVTNFHVPKSSLLILLSAIIPRKRLMELYNMAIQQEFRLFSFGDGMLILD